MPIISSITLNILPFSAEPVCLWDKQVDLLKFLYGILDDDFTIISEDGTVRHGNYRDLAPRYFEEGKVATDNWIKGFVDGASKAYPKPDGILEVDYSYFENDPVFGKTAKYIIAWQRMNAKALEDSLFFSIAHILETEFDISCALQLATTMYYKQALQILRGYLESLVLSVYLCEHPTEFDKWKVNNLRIPAMRGKQGMLQELVDRNVIPDYLAGQTSSLYDKLNGYIHGNEATLISKGVFTGNYEGLVFKEEDFHKWCNYIAQAIDLGIRLLAIHFDQWRAKPSGQVICDVCHLSDFDITEDWFAGEKHYHYTCRHCHSSMIRTD